MEAEVPKLRGLIDFGNLGVKPHILFVDSFLLKFLLLIDEIKLGPSRACITHHVERAIEILAQIRCQVAPVMAHVDQTSLIGSPSRVWATIAVFD